MNTLLEDLKAARDALDKAANGIQWYIHNSPDSDGSDDEALAEIQAARFAITARIELLEKQEPVAWLYQEGNGKPHASTNPPSSFSSAELSENEVSVFALYLAQEKSE